MYFIASVKRRAEEKQYHPEQLETNDTALEKGNNFVSFPVASSIFKRDIFPSHFKCW